MTKIKKEKIKEQGITLVALVIAIIILLILAGVTLNTALGQNGLIKRTREAVEKYENVSEQEQIQLGQLEQYFELLSKNGEENKTLEYELEAEDTDVIEGKTYIGKNGNSMGKMSNYDNQTLEASAVTNDDNYTIFTIPENGYYSTDSKIKTPKNSIKILAKEEKTQSASSSSRSVNVKWQVPDSFYGKNVLVIMFITYKTQPDSNPSVGYDINGLKNPEQLYYLNQILSYRMYLYLWWNFTRRVFKLYYTKHGRQSRSRNLCY